MQLEFFETEHQKKHGLKIWDASHTKLNKVPFLALGLILETEPFSRIRFDSGLLHSGLLVDEVKHLIDLEIRSLAEGKIQPSNTRILISYSPFIVTATYNNHLR